MLWFLFTLFAVLAIATILVLFAPYTVRYAVAFVEFQCINVFYSLLIAAARLNLFVEMRLQRAGHEWQLFRAYRKHRLAIRQMGLKVAQQCEQEFTQKYREL